MRVLESGSGGSFRTLTEQARMPVPLRLIWKPKGFRYKRCRISMTKPDKMGTLRLSSIGILRASTAVATNAPIAPIQKGNPGSNQATRRQTDKKARLPSKLFFSILVLP